MSCVRSCVFFSGYPISLRLETLHNPALLCLPRRGVMGRDSPERYRRRSRSRSPRRRSRSRFVPSPSLTPHLVCWHYGVCADDPHTFPTSLHPLCAGARGGTVTMRGVDAAARVPTLATVTATVIVDATTTAAETESGSRGATGRTGGGRIGILGALNLHLHLQLLPRRLLRRVFRMWGLYMRTFTVVYIPSHSPPTTRFWPRRWMRRRRSGRGWKR